MSASVPGVDGLIPGQSGSRTGARPDMQEPVSTIPISEAVRHTPPAVVPDTVLLRAWIESQDPQAFAAIVERYGPLVYRVAMRAVGDRHLADDVFQATFLVLAQTARKIQDGDLLSAWLHGTARNLARRALTLKHTERHLLARAPRLTRFQKGGEMSTSTEIDPLDELVRRHEQQLLDEELQNLPEASRAPLVLFYLEEKTQAEIAELMGLTVEAVEGRLRRAKHELRLRLIRRGVTLSGMLAAVMQLAPSAFAAPSPTLITSTISASVCTATGVTPVAVSSTATALATREVAAMSLASKTTAIIFGAAGMMTVSAGLLFGAIVTSIGQSRADRVASQHAEVELEDHDQTAPCAGLSQLQGAATSDLEEISTVLDESQLLALADEPIAQESPQKLPQSGDAERKAIVYQVGDLNESQRAEVLQFAHEFTDQAHYAEALQSLVIRASSEHHKKISDRVNSMRTGAKEAEVSATELGQLAPNPLAANAPPPSSSEKRDYDLWDWTPELRDKFIKFYKLQDRVKINGSVLEITATAAEHNQYAVAIDGYRRITTPELKARDLDAAIRAIASYHFEDPSQSARKVSELQKQLADVAKSHSHDDPKYIEITRELSLWQAIHQAVQTQRTEEMADLKAPEDDITVHYALSEYTPPIRDMGIRFAKDHSQSFQYNAAQNSMKVTACREDQRLIDEYLVKLRDSEPKQVWKRFISQFSSSPRWIILDPGLPAGIEAPALDPEIQEILDQWQAKADKTQSLSCPFRMTEIDKVLRTETRSEGRVTFAMPNQARLDFLPAGAEWLAKPGRSDANVSPYRVLTGNQNSWVVNQNMIYALQHQTKTFDRFELPSVIAADFLARLNPAFQLGFRPPHHSNAYEFRFGEQHNPDGQNAGAERIIHLVMTPRNPLLFNDYGSIECLLTPDSFQPTHFRVVDPSGRKEMDYSFELSQATTNTTPQANDPVFAVPDLKGWRLMHGTPYAFNSEAHHYEILHKDSQLEFRCRTIEASSQDIDELTTKVPHGRIPKFHFERAIHELTLRKQLRVLTDSSLITRMGKPASMLSGGEFRAGAASDKPLFLPFGQSLQMTATRHSPHELDLVLVFESTERSIPPEGPDKPVGPILGSAKGQVLRSGVRLSILGQGVLLGPLENNSSSRQDDNARGTYLWIKADVLRSVPDGEPQSPTSAGTIAQVVDVAELHGTTPTVLAAALKLLIEPDSWKGSLDIRPLGTKLVIRNRDEVVRKCEAEIHRWIEAQKQESPRTN